MIAPPGKPKMVETPSSTSDWHMARAPFKRICCTSFKQKSPPPYRGEVTSRGTTLFVALGGDIVRHPGPAYSPIDPLYLSVTLSLYLLVTCSSRIGCLGCLPDGSEAISGTCLHRSCTKRRLSAAARQFRTTPRQRLQTYSSVVGPNHTLPTLKASSPRFLERGLIAVSVGGAGA